MDNEFNKGIEFAFEYIEKHLVGHVVGYGLEGIVTEKMLKDLKQKIPRKCNVCPDKPCGTDWCPTKIEGEK
jgi:hypothetical protein